MSANGAGGLVLSLFPGVGLFDMAFELEGYCVVRGPDSLWGGDVQTFQPPAGKFDGVIGGPPCQRFSSMSNIVRARYGEGALAPDLIPEFARIVDAARPLWYVMENVRHAPLPSTPGYTSTNLLLNARSFGMAQNRARRFTFGVRGEYPVSLLAHVEFPSVFENPKFEYAVLGGRGRGGVGLKFDRGGIPIKQYRRDRRDRQNKRTTAEVAELQGLPRDFLDGAPLTAHGKQQALANGVPLALGRAIARAVNKAFEARSAAWREAG
jgi:DNA (cytosine-5)-methyltransferase 1